MTQLQWLAVLASVVATRAFQFDLPIGAEKCLGEFVAKDALTMGDFAVVDALPDTTTGVAVKVLGPANEVEYQKEDAARGKFAFTGKDSGTHKFCFTNGGQVGRRLSLDLKVGLEAKDYGEVARKEHLQPLELELRKLEEKVDEAYNEMMYQKEREEAHRNTNESTNARVLWFSVLSLVLLLGIAVTQLVILYQYFQREKIISSPKRFF